MAEKCIDLNRGLMMQPGEGGMQVYMYYDQPGHYYNIFCKELPEAAAEAAHFDVEKWRKLRAREERLAQAAAAIEADLAIESEETVVEEREGYKIVDYGFGRYKLIDPDENRLTAVPLSLEVVTKMLATFAPLPKVKQATA